MSKSVYEYVGLLTLLEVVCCGLYWEVGKMKRLQDSEEIAQQSKGLFTHRCDEMGAKVCKAV